jgi:homocysteine S-methyltransferase
LLRRIESLRLRHRARRASEYVKAGAEIIETNTYGASRVKLVAQGLDDKLAEINVAAAKLARKAAREARHDVFVAGAISPLGVRIEPYGPTFDDEAKDLFKEQVQALLEGGPGEGVDCFVLETFQDLAEMQQAIRAVRELCDHVIFAQMTINDRARRRSAPRQKSSRSGWTSGSTPTRAT